MTSLRLRLYSIGARMFVRPLFSVADNPDEIEKRMKRMVRHTSHGAKSPRARLHFRLGQI